MLQKFYKLLLFIGLFSSVLLRPVKKREKSKNPLASFGKLVYNTHIFPVNVRIIANIAGFILYLEPVCSCFPTGGKGTFHGGTEKGD
jgi:hypothetical protein